MKRTAGFTLLEMIVASLIMGIAVVGTLSSISAATRNAARLVEHDRATLLARARMNELLADATAQRDTTLSGEFEASQMGGKEAGWQARIHVFDRPRNAGPGTAVLDRVDLEVWWKSGGERRSYALFGYRTRLLTPADAVAMPEMPAEPAQ